MTDTDEKLIIWTEETIIFIVISHCVDFAVDSGFLPWTDVLNPIVYGQLSYVTCSTHKL